VAEIAPAGRHDLAPAQWFDRDRRRLEDARRPQAKEEGCDDGAQIGRDGAYLLQALKAAGVPPAWQELPAVRLLQTLWEQHVVTQPDGQLRWRTGDELAPAGSGSTPPMIPMPASVPNTRAGGRGTRSSSPTPAMRSCLG
jgi:hypothetical protein